MKEKLVEAILEAVSQAFDLSIDKIPAFNLEVPNHAQHGDFSTNVAMVLPRLLKKPPNQIATELMERLGSLDIVEKVELAGPGFINFFVRKQVWQSILIDILQAGENYGRSGQPGSPKVLVEFVSANPTGPLHFGHGRGAVVGDVLASLLQYSGFEVLREYYVNDAGAQVRGLSQSVLYHLMKQVGREVVFPENGYQGDYVAELAKQVPESLRGFLPNQPSEEELAALEDFCVATMLQQIKSDLDAFGITLDHFSSEKQLCQTNAIQAVFQSFKEQGVSQEKEGALWFFSDRFGDEKPRVLVKSDGSYTYFSTDIAYHRDKLKRGYERLINIWGADHHGYIARMKAALEALGYGQDCLDVLLVQMVSLVREGKPVIMSKRAGEIIGLRDVVEEVGKDAARFFFLLRSSDSQMEFDLELAKRRSMDNPVFYVQYGHARLCSILERAKEKGFEVSKHPKFDKIDLGQLQLAEEINLIKRMAEFGEVVKRAALARAPHLLVFYLQNLVGEFHSYYTGYSRSSPILGGGEELIKARLIMVLALRQVIRNALRLVGVGAPERMESLEVQETA